MKFFFPYKRLFISSVVLLVLLFVLFQSIAFKQLVSITFNQLLFKSLADGLIIMGLGILLSIIIPFANYVKLDFFQRLINCFALGIISIGLLLLLSYFASYIIVGAHYIEDIKKLLPLTAFIGILLYIIQIQAIQSRMKDERKEIDFEEENVGVSKSVTTNQNSFDNKIDENEILERIAVRIGQKIHVILIPDIIYIQADGDYVQIITGNGKYIKEETMKYFETKLPKAQFIRIHRSSIVNVEKILRIELYGKQNHILTLINGEKIKTSASGYKTLKEVLKL